ncbi:unnamed protein product [Darwinula stevensoni]|uniref:TLC domain-containing protein n=1 Tax=Darwinula stevensoni TaxID=69355 RepID=A0A7R8X588_9CRUS|nr:unnamed protein product [Darwinula stevensoni]CAG0880633.1 unnamed protein product [Darwinula stevensoni]
MVFVVGLMFHGTAPFASLFVALHHNTTLPEHAESTSEQAVHHDDRYSYGAKDFSCIFFYTLICVIIHAVIQEYLLDKVNRKLHLSKINHRKFNESGQLLIFYVVSALWGGNIIMKEKLIPGISHLWEGYPTHHAAMTFTYKFFFVSQVAYYLHQFPELYFQKVKREDLMNKITVSLVSLFLVVGAYLLCFTRVALCLLVPHYAVECVFHVARILHFAEQHKAARYAFGAWDVLFVAIRLLTVVLSVLTFWYGLALAPNQGIDIVRGNFNTPLIRLNTLLVVCLLQAWLMWNFFTFHLKRMRERAAVQAATTAKRRQTEKKSKKDHENGKRTSDDDVSELPEADQYSKKEPALRQRPTARVK